MIIVNPQEASRHTDILEEFDKHGQKYIIDPEFNLSDFAVQGIDEDVIIERKAINDFWASVKDGRLWTQAKDLSNIELKKYVPLVVLELSQIANFSYNPITKKWKYVNTVVFKENEINFYMAEFGLTRFGVYIILTSSPQGTARFLIHLSEKLGQPKEKRDYPERQGFRKNMTLQEKRLYILDAFGHETAKAILNTYQSITKFILESTKTDFVNELANIKLASGRRIGEKKALEILEVIK